MMEMKHTAGPWEVRGCELVGEGTLLATLHWHSGRSAENEADARLIAAAPDLLEPAPNAADILEQYAEYVRTVKADELERHPYLPLIEETAADLRAAIAKAIPHAEERG